MVNISISGWKHHYCYCIYYYSTFGHVNTTFLVYIILYKEKKYNLPLFLRTPFKVLGLSIFTCLELKFSIPHSCPRISEKHPYNDQTLFSYNWKIAMNNSLEIFFSPRTFYMQKKYAYKTQWDHLNISEKLT